MPQTARRGSRRSARRENLRTATVVTSPTECCVTPETIAEEIYVGTETPILIESCCDGLQSGCSEYDTRRRCPYWPKFAHPRWLTCEELHSRKI